MSIIYHKLLHLFEMIILKNVYFMASKFVTYKKISGQLKKNPV